MLIHTTRTYEEKGRRATEAKREERENRFPRWSICYLQTLQCNYARIVHWPWQPIFGSIKTKEELKKRKKNSENKRI